MRIITFKSGEVKSQKRFELLYGAMLLGGQQPGARGGIEVLRREARILDALDAISTPESGNEETRSVVIDSVLSLQQPDFELLKKRLEEAPWLPKIARNVVDAVDWLGTAAEKET